MFRTRSNVSLPFRLHWLILCCAVAACGRQSAGYFPLEAGRYWQYTVQRTTMDGSVTQKYLIQTTPGSTLDGVEVHAKQTVDGSQYFYRTTAEGIRRIAQKLRGDSALVRNDPAPTVLPADLKVGAGWQQASRTSVLENTGPPWEKLFQITEPITLDYTIESVSETVRVPAGEFHDCLRVAGRGRVSADVGNFIGRADITVSVTEWYAPGVGLVRSRRLETTDAQSLNRGELLMELETYR